MTDLPERLDLTSQNPLTDRVAALRSLFPDVFQEDKLDVDALRRAVGDSAETGPERFGLNWPGKAECMRVIQEPSIGTLVPMRDESVEFDTTQNVIIEGENLEVLKLLQKAYYGKVKLIYIDPPYNTGNEFIYPDNFREGLSGYLRYSGQVGDDGLPMSANTETDGRFHSKWLSMMYPRLFLARNLMRNDGVIFVSIDDVELFNVRLLMDELFGSENFLGCITVVSNLKGRSDDKYFARCHNYLLCYARGDFVTAGVPLPEQYWDDYPEVADDGRRFRLQGLRKRGSNSRREDRPRMYYPIYVDPGSRSVSLSPHDAYTEEVLPRLSDGADGCWRWGIDTVAQRLDELCGARVGGKRWDVFQIDYAETAEGTKRIIPKTVWTGPEFANESGTLEVKRLLGKGAFSNPKPIGLVTYMLEQATGPTDIVLDFFAGSGTTGHAVMVQNAADGGSRRHILVQLPEPVNNPEYPTIAAITRERIRRAARVLNSEQTTLDSVEQDRGFRAFRLTSSNFSAWDGANTSEEGVAAQLITSSMDDPRRTSLLSCCSRLDTHSPHPPEC